MNELVPQGTEAVDWSVEPDGPVMLPWGTGLFDVETGPVAEVVAPFTHAVDLGGRPYAFTEEKQAAYLERIREGDGRDAAAHRVGVAPNTVRAHRKRFPEFEEQIKTAESVRNGNLVSAAYKHAMAGNARMLEFLMKNWMPDEYKDRSEPRMLQQINAGPSVEWSLQEAREEAHKALDELEQKRRDHAAKATVDVESREADSG